MKWDAHNPEGRGTPRVSSGWMDQFLAREFPRQVQMLDDIHARLERDRARSPDGLPSKEHMRAARFAQDGFKHMVEMRFQAAKLELDARRITRGQAPMTDEEYQAKLQALGRDAVRSLPAAERAQGLTAEELEAELARRRALASGT